MKKEDIHMFINNVAINKKGIFLLDYVNTQKLIELCKQSNIDVLGIEAFSLHDEAIQPHLDKSIDFSSEFNKYTTPDEYLKQLNNGDLQLLFEVTI